MNKTCLHCAKAATLSIAVMGFMIVMAPNNMPALAQQTANAEEIPEACFKYPAKADDKIVDTFLVNPSNLLAAHPNGGIQMANVVRQLAGSDNRTIAPLLALNEAASAAQRAAIGAALARVVQACSPSALEFAAFVQEKVAELEPGALLTAFEAASSDVQTADIGEADTTSTLNAAPANLVPGTPDTATQGAIGDAENTSDSTFITGSNSRSERDRSTSNSLSLIVSPTN